MTPFFDRLARLLPFLIPAAAVGLVLAHSLVWYLAVQRLRQELDGAIAGRQSAGWEVKTGPISTGGWPLSAELTAPAMLLRTAAATDPRAITWKAERLDLHVGLLHPRTLLATVSGKQALALGGLAEVPFTTDGMQAQITLAPHGAAQSAVLSVTRLRATLPAGPLTIGTIAAAITADPTAARAVPLLSTQLNVTDIILPGQGWPLGPKLASLGLDARLTGPLPAAGTLPAQLGAWRDGGGLAEVQRMGLTWGKLALNATAQLGLDARLQPSGTGAAQISGYNETLDALTAAQMLPAQSTRAAKAVLGLLARRPAADGQPAQVDIPLAVQNQVISVAGMPLLRIGEVVWQPAP